jgi:predicted GIY-YIG superfamily endonuclease
MVNKISYKYLDRKIKDKYNLNRREKRRLNREKKIALGLPLGTRKPMFYWTRERILDEALKYKTKQEWALRSPGSYDAAKGIPNLYKEATKHMVLVGSKFKRCLYSITIQREKLVYIGLTFNLKQRVTAHLNTKRFVNLIKKYGRGALKIKQETEYLESNFAAKLEIVLIKNFRKDGWNVLNIARGGSLGGTTIKWTEKNILISLENQKSFKDWRENHPSGYSALLKNKKLKEKVHSTLPRGSTLKWTKGLIIKEALKFKTRSEWARKSYGSYVAAKRFGILEEVSKHMVVLRKAPTNNRIIEDGSNYKTRGEWKENSGSIYAYALKDKELFRIATAHMKPKWYGTKREGK